ncbi:methylated-DNA--[protein]-cysteine S-methyltransferase [Saccharothrix longispora]|uniref:Methylated-DNA-[protein]-cysteine S-methyltransferase n=1 Tax=Saccharothrix longispora TaxID=33920 RepID=A0ABU1Q7Q6_9PSEU|nr:methylated-DNA--[protein]-cysteine S-methyltransferase [Saccharothrix longispora]MDR6598154.1 methylated-DNA-[protein]-cysteine S-methyltransferase [Saccharothrix longispora]
MTTARTTANVSATDTPIGPFTAVVAPDGAVLASGWTTDVAELLSKVAPRLRPANLVERPDLGAVTRAVRAYHDGDLAVIDDVPVRQEGGAFTAGAWRALRTVPAGEPISYTGFALLAGRPSAVRAAAGACAKNPATLFVPCHRVVAANGPGGFRWGAEVKGWLLAHEARAA